MSDASYPEELYYIEEHDWARVDGDTATFGITWYAQDTLGEVVYFSPSSVGTQIQKGGEYGELESTKAVSSLIAPLSGEVIEVNDALEGSESSVNDDPYGQGWLVKIRLSDPSEAESLMDSSAYQTHVDSL
ncbi:MAG: glycine cleavage system protein [Gaiellales bacterium]|jgi:glycine cleavage system H protein|nr:glycine cleavage system protein [Gaiellales bacterium]